MTTVCPPQAEVRGISTEKEMLPPPEADKREGFFAA